MTMDLLLFTQMFAFLYHCQDFYRTGLYIYMSNTVSNKKQETLTGADSVFFLVGSILCVFMLRFPNKNHVRFIFTFSCLQECSCLIYIICVCLRIVVSNTYCVVFLFCLSSSMWPVSLDFSCFIAPSVFFNVYLVCKSNFLRKYFK